MYDTYQTFYKNMTVKHTLKMVPELIASSAEFQQINELANAKTQGPSDGLISNSDSVELSKLFGKLRMHMQKPQFEHPLC